MKTAIITRTCLALAILAMFAALEAAAQPNLTPFQPPNWSDEIVVTTNSSSTIDATNLITLDSLYVDWSVINDGASAVNVPFFVYLYVDGVYQQQWEIGAPLGVNHYTYVTGYPIGSLSAGTHTIEIDADATGVVTESNESDNTYTKTITVTLPTLPNLSAPVPATPTNASTGQFLMPAFTWSPVTNAAFYRLLVATNAADLPTNPAVTTGGASLVVNVTNASTYFAPPFPLPANQPLYWEVAAGDNQQYGNWSAINSFTATPPSGHLTIIPTFDSSITSDPQAAAIETTIKSAISAYQLNFSDNVTVNIVFEEMGAGLGLSTKYDYTFGYSSYLSALTSHATTADDSTALAHLPGGSANPVNGNASVELHDGLARALGFSAPPTGGIDGTIYLNTSIMNLSTATNNPNNFSLFATASHEMDEVLGFGSALDQVKNTNDTLTGFIEPEDLFRYATNGTRSYTTNTSGTSFFSLDGTTDLAQFNQDNPAGDFGDWNSYPGLPPIPEVQDAFATPAATPVLGVELRALDAIGFTRISVPIIMVASAGAGGGINPNGTFNQTIGSNQLFTATPNAGSTVSQWLLDGSVAQTNGTTYTLSNLQSGHSVQVTFNTASLTNQTITFAPLPNRAFGEPPFGLSATASSGLPVSFSILSGPATNSGTNVTLTGTGAVTVQASQAGNSNYNAASNVDQSFTVYSPPRISFAISSHNLVATWSTNVPGFTLQGATNLNPVINWTNVTPGPFIVGGLYTVTNSTTGAAHYYRLKK